MKNVLWAIQSICPPQDAQQLMTACAALGIETCVIENSAVGELPNVATNRPVLFYGSCRFIRKIVASGRWHPGAYYDDRNFRFSESLRHWGARMLNREAVFLLLGEFSAARFAASPKIFVRPDRDLKELSGCVWPVSDFAEYVDKLRAAGNRTALDMPIVVAPTRQIDSEWRLHVIDGKVSTGSRYELFGDLDYSTELPDTLCQFAEETAKIWSPARAFVMDLAMVGDTPMVLEFNGINSAGFYHSDVKRVVADIVEGIPSF